MSTLTWVLGRVRDFLHERHIESLSQTLRMNGFLPFEVRWVLWDDLRRAINSRSVEQVRRMEKAKGLRR